MKNSLFNNHVLKICTAVVMLSFLLIGCFTPIDQLYGSVGINKGEWLVKFNPGNSSLLLEHSLSGARLTGELSFQVETRNKPKKWLIVASRDSITERPALLDADGNVQGYLSFTGSGDTVHISVIHRAAQSYKGTLLFKGTAQLGRQTFACRTRPNGASRVVQMASGPADSRLNDSLFDVTTDTALRLTGQMVSLLSGRDGVDSPVFDLEMAAVPQDTLYSQLTFQAKRNYYRSQYVPYYKPIDKKRCPSPPTGWMSWNAYFDTAGEKENLDEAHIGVKQLKPFGMEIWHIESWQDNSDKLPVAKFHNLTLRPDPKKFPSGMKWLADRITELGFVPGIWTVPFGTGDDVFYAAHKEWFLHGPDGKPMRNWNGYYVIDPSQKAVREHMEETHRVMSHDWGYKYFKIDGMSGRGPGYSAHFFERTNVCAAFKEKCEDPFRMCIEALRRGIGPDRIWLACQGHYTGPEIGQADAGRIGADIVHPGKDPHWENYSNQAWTTINQLFVNNIVWYNDPDTLMVGVAPLNVARLATAVVGLPGQMMFAGDKLAGLSAERMRLLQQCLPVCDVRPLDLFPIFQMLPVWDLKIRRSFGSWDVVSLFNWNEVPADVGFSFDELGLPANGEYLVYDFWNHKLLGVVRGQLVRSIEGRANMLLAIHPALNRPQLLSTDRHITQGAVELENVAWDEAGKVLSGVVRLVGGYPTELVFNVPKGFELVKAAADGVEQVKSDVKTADGTLCLTLKQPASGPAKWRLEFKR
ncbi:MAG: hypothetical protein A2283_13235 [Lentisphaerae bacterium RIFOXYA12_FULL_48_11]|nr:MAG: hypothetical protein A2283_13235 [Lentisphaerae bacterium RIFOXYA12_FULL_48_11]